MLTWLPVDVSSWYSSSQHFLFHSLTESCLVSDFDQFISFQIIKKKEHFHDIVQIRFFSKGDKGFFIYM